MYLSGKVELYIERNVEIFPFECTTTFQTAKLSTYNQCYAATRVFAFLTITIKTPASSLLGYSGFSSRLGARPMVLSASTFSQCAPDEGTKKSW